MSRIILVPTPVGNLEDITLRALEVLKNADLVAAEDTRTSGILLKHYGIQKSLVSLHKFNEHGKVGFLLDKVINDHLTLTVISDAGTPGISDPGFFLVREAINRNLIVEVLPGPTALIPALVASGLPCDKFVFEGFLPVKKGRQTRMKFLAEEERTIVFYESPHRIEKTLTELGLFLGMERNACVAREISKKFEEYHRGTLNELAEYFKINTPKGEMVVVVAGKS